MKIDVHPPADGPICDFCSQRPVKWRYPASDIKPIEAVSMPDELMQNSIGDWAACDICHGLIESDDRRGLAIRSTDLLVMAHPELADQYGKLMDVGLRMQEDFFAARTGPAIPVE